MTPSPDATMRIAEQLQRRVRAVMASGVDIRNRVAGAVAWAARGIFASAEDTGAIIEATVAGGSQAVRAELPAQREAMLRQVVEGVGDGLATAALAVEITLLEAGRNGLAFASAEVAHAADEFASIPDAFLRRLADGLARAGSHGASAFGSLVDHAGVTLRRIEPVLRKAAEAAQNHPGVLAREASTAGKAALRSGAAAFVRAVCQQLQALGVSLAERHDRGG